MTKKFHILLIVALAAVSSAFGASVRVSVSPQRGKSHIETGDLFYLSIEVTDITAAPQKPDNVGGAKLIYFDRTREESGFSSINGVTTRSYAATYTATMRATKEGSYSYGPVSVGGVKSNQVRYTIGNASATQAHPSTQTGNVPDSSDDTDKPKYIGKGDGNLFLRASVSSSTAYEQQALVYTVKLYTTYDAIKFVGATAAPKFDGFVIEESKDISSSLSFETYQGKTYATAVIARYIIFPQMTGNLKVTGNNYTIAVDRREYYHDSFFGNMSFSTPLQLNVSPNDLVVNVKELPAPKPADFSGAVGRFRLTSSLAGSQFKTNQAASVVYTLTGTGNIKYVQMPDLSAQYPPEIEVYTPTTKQDVKVGSSNVSGTVTFDYSFMPLEEGSFRIPDVRLVYFDPETGKYETTVAKGYSIQVGKGSASGQN
ncbi:MAG: BatD family protein, partial [Muribaculaceae bacterium]|nr:BatD family protein [Muribaculaceae bacterium]